MWITASYLKHFGFHADHVEQFETLYPSGVKLTQSLCIEHKDCIAWGWVADVLLPAKGIALFKARSHADRMQYLSRCGTAAGFYQQAAVAIAAEYAAKAGLEDWARDLTDEQKTIRDEKDKKLAALYEVRKNIEHDAITVLKTEVAKTFADVAGSFGLRKISRWHKLLDVQPVIKGSSKPTVGMFY
jgi:hypothetical protein